MSKKRKKRQPLGRGVDSLFTKPKGEEVEKEEVVEETVEAPSGVDASVMERAIELAEMNPRLSIYSKKVCAVMRYLVNTIPAFNRSEEARKILEEGLRERYPRLWERVKELG